MLSVSISAARTISLCHAQPSQLMDSICQCTTVYTGGLQSVQLGRATATATTKSSASYRNSVQLEKDITTVDSSASYRNSVQLEKDITTVESSASYRNSV